MNVIDFTEDSLACFDNLGKAIRRELKKDWQGEFRTLRVTLPLSIATDPGFEIPEEIESDVGDGERDWKVVRDGEPTRSVPCFVNYVRV